MRYLMIVAIVTLAICTLLLSPVLTSTSGISGHFGCLFSASLCHVDEDCIDDNLFGKCQRRSQFDGHMVDSYQYHLSGAQLSELYHIIQRLVAAGYTWRHRDTQCVLYAVLARYRHGAMNTNMPSVCTDSFLHEGWFEADLMNSSQHGMQRVSPNVGTRLSGNYDKAFGDFQKFMQGLQANDLFALKQFLLDRSAYRRPVSVTTGRGPAEPSVVTDAEDLSASDKDAGREMTWFSDESRHPSSVQLQALNKKTATNHIDFRTSSDDSEQGVNFESSSDSSERRQIILYVLIGLAAVLAVVFVVIFVQYCHTYRTVKEEELGGLVSHRVTPEEYEDLCRQHMGSKLSAKPDVLLNGTAEKANFDLRQLLSRMSSVRSATPSLQDEPIGPQIDMNTGTLVLAYMEGYVRDNDRIHREWDELAAASASVDLSDMASDAFKPTNARKNRYADILPYEKSRVVLNVENSESGSSYINASTIVDGDPRNPVYIATQGPLEHTVDDFWQMIWEQGCVVIVNLTCLVEDGVPLCRQYWPDVDRQFYHIYEVVMLSSHVNCDDYVVRNFTIRNVQTGELRNVTQFHFLSWPSSGPAIPDSVSSLLDFRRRVKKSFRGHAPVVVHCSDGSGRTGTYCLIDLVLNRIVNGVKQVDIAATLEHLRDQRHLMVHTKEQYEFALSAVAQEVHSLLSPSIVHR